MRSLRLFEGIPGWRRLVGAVTSTSASAPFVVVNGSGRGATYFAGNAGSFIDRQLYLFGHYERHQIAAFLSLVPRIRRRVILDIGANIGTHSLAFARAFGEVHAFEPNADLWSRFERNMSLNGFPNVTLHRIGIADRDATLDLYSIDKDNEGLSTFSTVEQYDLPLRRKQTAAVCRGDSYLQAHNVRGVDAIKIDVQGFEPEVLRGLRETLRADRPYVWFEVGRGTQNQVDTVADLAGIFGYDFDLFGFVSQRYRGSARQALVQIHSDRLTAGDYVIAPRT